MAPMSMKKVQTVLNNPDYERLLKYAKKKGMSLYAVLKTALFEFMERHP